MNIIKVDKANGLSEWIYWEDSIQYPKTMPLTLTYNSFKDYLIIGSTNFKPGNTSDAIITLHEPLGANTYKLPLIDEYNKYSLASTSIVTPDSGMWIGGALNQIAVSKAGFIYDMRYTQAKHL